MKSATSLNAERVCDFHRHRSEVAGYLSAKHGDIYYVLHSVKDPVAQVVLAGPFASERAHSYAPWVRWARFLAQHRIQALRFDYSGTGESTGRFEDVSFSEWHNDLETVAGWLGRQASRMPLAFCGLGLGGLLASQTFARGIGDAMLLWSPPSQGMDVLREALRRRAAADFIMQEPSQRKSLVDYIRQLESGGTVKVEGYEWSSRLWREAGEYRLMLPEASADTPPPAGRPWRMLRLNRSVEPLVGGIAQWRALNPSAQPSNAALNPNLSSFYQSNLDWLLDALKIPPHTP